jgi:hypothetical protein
LLYVFDGNSEPYCSFHLRILNQQVPIDRHTVFYVLLKRVKTWWKKLFSDIIIEPIVIVLAVPTDKQTEEVELLLYTFERNETNFS